MARFAEGQTIQAHVTAQGMVKGELYDVVSVHERYLPFGNFVTYVLRPHTAAQAAPEFAVGNLHLLAGEVAA